MIFTGISTDDWKHMDLQHWLHVTCKQPCQNILLVLLLLLRMLGWIERQIRFTSPQKKNVTSHFYTDPGSAGLLAVEVVSHHVESVCGTIVSQSWVMELWEEDRIPIGCHNHPHWAHEIADEAFICSTNRSQKQATHNKRPPCVGVDVFVQPEPNHRELPFS